MKKALIGTLGLGLVIGAMSISSFANEKESSNAQLPTGTSNQVLSSTSQGNADFMVLNKETNQFENLDDSDYRNANPNYGQSCPHMNFGDYGNRN